MCKDPACVKIALAWGPGLSEPKEQRQATLQTAWARRRDDFYLWRRLGSLDALLHQAHRALRRLDMLSAHALFEDDEAYPSTLRRRGGPAVLYYRGAIAPLRRRCVSIVGARAATAPKRALAKTLAEVAIKAGFTVISGGALGIDAAAHRGALSAGGATIALLGSSLDRLYPARNIPLFETICHREGGLLTCFAPGEGLARWHFPRRNRWIAACAELVIVVEAGARSGALNTARLARQLDVPCAAVPGSPGSNSLLRRGALRIDRGDQLTTILSGKSLPTRPAPDDADERAMLNALGQKTLQLDALCRSCDLSVARGAAALIRLEIAGRVEPLVGGAYRALV